MLSAEGDDDALLLVLSDGRDAVMRCAGEVQRWRGCLRVCLDLGELFAHECGGCLSQHTLANRRAASLKDAFSARFC